MHLIEDIIDEFLSPFEMLLSVTGEIIGLIITFFAAVIGLLLFPIRMSMLVSDLQAQLNEISMFINAIQWLSNGISYVSNTCSIISSMTSSGMGLTVLGITVGNILWVVVEIFSLWLFFYFIDEISH